MRFSLDGLTPLESRRITRWFALAAGGFIAIHLILQVIEHFGGGVSYLILDLFNVDVEPSFPTWYSSMALLACSGLLALIAQRRRGDRFERHWKVLALTFLALSAEEIAGIHEAINTALPFPWTGPAAVLTGIFGLLYLPFLGHLDRRTRWWFIAAGLVYVGGAVGIEQALGWFGGHPDLESFAYALWTAAEEGAEMAGVVMLIHALLGLLQDQPSRANP